MKPPRRAGFSLLEVLLATAILLGCLIVLGQLAAVGRDHARSAEDLTTAQLLCQTKLNEVLAGVTPVRTVEQEPLEETPGWVYSIEVDSLGQPGLVSLRVTVSEDVGEVESGSEERPATQFTLTRWIRDPDRDADVDSEPEPLEAPLPEVDLAEMDLVGE